MSLIKCENITIGYEGKPVMQNLNINIKQGDYLCIVGENGSGKTTLMKALLGLHPVMKGSVIYAEGLKQNQIGYLPQQSSAQRDFPASVFEIVLSGTLNSRRFNPFYSREQKKKAREKRTDIRKKDCYFD